MAPIPVKATVASPETGEPPPTPGDVRAALGDKTD